ncbi:MAG: uroporphyrinogen-III synthase [Epsilonproteobacteria bacterium]|nr:uroporphyrinogen-III synthase [Campylobacterota bacterium]
MIYVLNEREFKDAKNLPVIKINYFDKKVDIKPYDALIFTSKNGVEAIDRVNKEWKDKDVYSIGSATTKYIKSKGKEPVYTAKSSYGDDFAHEIKDKLLNKKVLFLRAKTVTSDLNGILKRNGIELDEVIVYETICNQELKIPPKKGSVIIFSSPSTIECFFKNFKWDDSYKAVVIGKKTASFMPKGISYTISQKQTIDSCIDSAKRIIAD